MKYPLVPATLFLVGSLFASGCGQAEATPLTPDEIAQSKHTLTLKVKDAFGPAAVVQRTFNIDTSILVGVALAEAPDESDVFPICQHSGLEFLYMLEGEVAYRHGTKTYVLTPGDSLFFDAEAPHGPEELRRLPIRFLSVICYTRETR